MAKWSTGARYAAIAAMGAMALGAVSPWVRAEGPDAAAQISGWDHGGPVVLMLASAAALAFALRRRRMVLLVACAAGSFALLALYSLPGAVLADSAGRLGLAEVTWGGYLVLAGAATLACAALARPGRAH